MMRRKHLARTVAIAVALMMAVDLVPVAGSTAVYANSDGKIVTKNVYLSPAEIQAERDKAEKAIDEKEGVVDEDNIAAAPVPEIADPAVTAQGDIGGGYSNAVKESDISNVKIRQDASGMIYVSEPDSAGRVTVTGLTLPQEDLEYDAVYVGDDVDSYDNASLEKYFYSDEAKSFSITIDMTEYNVGFHTIWVKLSDGTYLRAAYVPTFVTKVACNDPDYYYAYSTYFYYKYGGTTYSDLDIFMDYKKADDPNYSEEVYMIENPDEEYVKDGLEENTSYNVRMMYGRKFEYGGRTWIFTGRQNGCVSEPVVVATGSGKLLVKSVKAKGKNKVHRYKVWIGWRVWYRNGREIKRKKLYRRYKYYTSKFTITVKLKKKQGLAGLYIGTVNGMYAWKKGDKTTYKQKFSRSGKTKGKKISVMIVGAKALNDGYFSGFSEPVKKKIKVK